ncbi:MAG: hypothetical protein OEZ01_09885 [Candidatus Heimdallarchaeota archaeon]|nr:hypothetical protein [Candidatus Heimdallarchaeota archaeon]MDH5646307.1 hypothetical protein [Candidatus Heimdallarchaeota archaeon]
MVKFFSKNNKSGAEKSFKTGEIGPRYLASFKRVHRTIPTDYSKDHAPDDNLIKEVTKLLETIIEQGKKFEQYKELRDEYLLICVKELGNMQFSILIDEGKVEFFQGMHNKDEPSIVLPISIRNLKGFLNFIEDEEIDRRELFIIMRFFAIPILKDLYDSKVLYLPGNKWKYKYDDFIQIEILPDEPIVEKGEILDIKMTVVNVDGQWLIFKGFEGDPDWRLTLSMDDALRMWWLGTQEPRKHSKNPLKLRSISKEFLQILDQQVSYLREDHEREFTTQIDELEVEDEPEVVS